MIRTSNLLRKRVALACGIALAALTASPAFAQAQEGATPARAGTPIDGRLVLDLLVQNGVVTRAQADAVISQAEAAAPVTPPQVAQVPPSTEPGVQRVAFIPEIVRDQIKQELREEVTQQAKAEGWAAPGQVPGWLKGITLSGDVLVRSEMVLFDRTTFNANNEYVSGNFPYFPDFQAINAGPGFDVNGIDNIAPLLNTSENRERLRLRARLGIHAQLDDWISAEIRIATGSDNGPVSTNQTLGSGVELGKYELWLDRANIVISPLPNLRFAVGRAENPFWTSPLLFDNDLNFDGLSARYSYAVADGVEAFGTAGAFPIYNTAFNVGSTNVNKVPSRNKYLLAGQLGVSVAPADDIKVTLAGGYFVFGKAEGEFSSPCFAYLDTCDTDITRPQFVQFGNTMFALRDIVADPSDPTGPQLQYYGLASKFRVLNLHAGVDVTTFDPVKLRLEGDYINNLGFDRNAIVARIPENNLDGTNRFDGGNQGWSLNLIVGEPETRKRGDWNLAFGYRYIESDATIDAFNDSDFHLGGTNAQGYILGAEYGVGRNTSVGIRWLSSNEVTGAPYSVDTLQLDLQSKF